MALGPFLDVVAVMTAITAAVAPLRRRIRVNPPLPQRGISSPAARKHPRRVLVVDDEPLIRWSVTESLTGHGLDVEQASDAASALRAIITKPLPFDVVVLDLRLPDMRDLSLLGTIRQLLPDATLVLMTAYGTDDVLERAVALGAATVLNKPFELGSLIDAVYGVAG
jgi:DNA-binding NtrC family response regulator